MKNLTIKLNGTRASLCSMSNVGVLYLSRFGEANGFLAASHASKKNIIKNIKAVLTLHLVTVGGLSCLRRGEARAVAEEARLPGGLGLAQTPLRLYACPQWT